MGNIISNNHQPTGVEHCSFDQLEIHKQNFDWKNGVANFQKLFAGKVSDTYLGLSHMQNFSCPRKGGSCLFRWVWTIPSLNWPPTHRKIQQIQPVLSDFQKQRQYKPIIVNFIYLISIGLSIAMIFRMEAT